ncbi:MAG: hypothetical protein EOO07_28355 [Chitinophagaceae bacterium]|nr:MAG: hypothetical protein EOO07_28355 [Chitinophagaceae bacterium]
MHQPFNRQSIRLRGYDYSKEGLYFITICCQGRLCRFGEIVNGQMILNDAGKQAQICWLSIPEHFTNVVLHEFVVMPNHVHGIIEINAPAVGANHHLPSQNVNPLNIIRANNDLPPRHGTSRTIGSMVRGFKIGVTKWFIANYNIKNIWQRNYYEHIINDEDAYQNISNYIENNPLNWGNDKFQS